MNLLLLLCINFIILVVFYFGIRKLRSFTILFQGAAYALALPEYYFSYVPFFFFIFLLPGYFKVGAFTTDKVIPPPPIKTLLRLFVLAYLLFIAILIIQSAYSGFTYTQFPNDVIHCIFLFSLSVGAYLESLPHAIGCIFIKKKQHHTGKLVVIDKEVISGYRYIIINYVTLFEHSSNLFIFHHPYYHLIQKKTNATFSYTINHCIWNITYMSNLKLVDDSQACCASFEKQ